MMLSLYKKSVKSMYQYVPFNVYCQQVITTTVDSFTVVVKRKYISILVEIKQFKMFKFNVYNLDVVNIFLKFDSKQILKL